MRAAQIPGGAGAGRADSDGAASHLLIQFVHHAHELFATLALGVALRRVEQGKLFGGAVADLHQHHAAFHVPPIRRVQAVEYLNGGADDGAAVVGGVIQLDDHAGVVLGEILPVRVGAQEHEHGAAE